MKIYTRTGDDGTTGLFGGPRVRKDNQRIQAFGAVDELNAILGLVRASAPPAVIDRQTESIQHSLFAIGAELASPDPVGMGTRMLTSSHIEELEHWIDELDSQLPELRQFILPGGTPQAAQLHLARGVCRRAEREVVTLIQSSEEACDGHLVLLYLNRLGDLLFVQARYANWAVGNSEVTWQKPTQ